MPASPNSRRPCPTAKSSAEMPTAGPRRPFDRHESANRGGRVLLIGKRRSQSQAAKGGMYALGTD